MRKIAGILAEGGTFGNGAAGAGWCSASGVNVLPGAYPPDVASRATSLETELGRAVDRGVLLGWNALPRCRADTRTCATGGSLPLLSAGGRARGPRGCWGAASNGNAMAGGAGSRGGAGHRRKSRTLLVRDTMPAYSVSFRGSYGGGENA